ncbi:hypothetical protein [Alteribacter natronophilus]|uniref:hypothetical protein n=1 Tax=Alteribacter natronophilus TaxID=2583810 RepID=UPI00110DA73D|nr:hypothetical protein [Alteribacter natronophilus]TMW70071.1 hypothetical protein FGB90_17980 [Alteribacter natronophilus]
MDKHLRSIIGIIVLVIACLLILDLQWWAGAFLLATGLYGIAVNWKAYKRKQKHAQNENRKP